MTAHGPKADTLSQLGRKPARTGLPIGSSCYKECARELRERELKEGKEAIAREVSAIDVNGGDDDHSPCQSDVRNRERRHSSVSTVGRIRPAEVALAGFISGRGALPFDSLSPCQYPPRVARIARSRQIGRSGRPSPCW
jgi:hypothetical protein